MFLRVLRTVRAHLGALASTVDPDAMTGAQAAAAIEVLAAIEKAAAGLRLILTRRLDDPGVAAETGERSSAHWLAKQTGQSVAEATKDLECSRRLEKLPAAEQAVRAGGLSADQARLVADGAAADPSSERELVETATKASVAELARAATARKAAAAGDDAARAAAARERRSFRRGVNADGSGWGAINGPALDLAKLDALLKPHQDAVFDQARREGRREPFDRIAYDALLSLLGIAPANTSDTDRDGDTGPVPATAGGAPVTVPAQIILRADLAATKRGFTKPGETCDIRGLGPIPVTELRHLLPDAAITLVLSDGVDAFNVTNLSRKANAVQQMVLWLLDIGCTRHGCTATDHLQVDHRIDWHKVKVTELTNLDWLCPHDHKLKTHHGWRLEPGTGKRQMHPPGDQWWLHEDHPDRPAPPGDPPQHHAA